MGDDVPAASDGVVKHQCTTPPERGVSWSKVCEPRTPMGAGDGRGGRGWLVAVRLSAFLVHVDGARLPLE